ncbi:MAG: hypothetical protein U9O41_06095 [Candidatus Aerophobetes bacterium]|nr:hypothetical protein [Candidatus Aerophobetes bacterium]
MKKLAITTLIILAVLINTAIAFQNEPDGFRGLKWGDPPTEDMEYWKTEAEELRYYRIENDKKRIGDVDYMINYVFCGQPEQFGMVTLDFRGENNYALLEMLAKGLWGEPTNEKFSEEVQILTWADSNTLVGVELHFYLPEEKGTLTFFNFAVLLEPIMGKHKDAE